MDGGFWGGKDRKGRDGGWEWRGGFWEGFGRWVDGRGGGCLRGRETGGLEERIT